MEKKGTLIMSDNNHDDFLLVFSDLSKLTCFKSGWDLLFLYFNVNV